MTFMPEFHVNNFWIKFIPHREHAAYQLQRQSG